MSSPPARPGRRRSSPWRSLVGLVALGLLLVAAVVAGVVLVPAWLADPDERLSAADRIQRCESEHGVADQPVAATGEQVLRRCAWPAPGEHADGYYEIAMTVNDTTRDGKELVAYTFSAGCEVFGYRLGENPTRRQVRAGQVVDGSTGGPVELTAELLEVVPELSPGTLAVLTTGERPVTDIACVR